MVTNKLVLFDIDGTLIDPAGAGRRSISKTFQNMFSIKNAFASIEMVGKTDIQIIKEGLKAHRLPSQDGVLQKIIATYLESLKEEVKPDAGQVILGVIDFLEALTKMEGWWVGLLTGNMEQGARIKLGAFDLNKYFSIGAFGDDDEDRNRLLPVAVKKFREETGLNMEYGECIVIGDTPHDVECSKLYGALSIAVATGPYHYETLVKTEADHVLKDLSRAIDLISGF